ncbi:MAG: DUF6600 domain-containing protein [Hyphomicrobiales bacterium]
MRKRILAFALALGIAALLGGCAVTYSDRSPEPYPYGAADYGYFYDALAPYGAWYDVEPYGWVWTPYDVPVGWRPYTYGHWIYTSYGWTWASDDPWGWAPYHYGRWTWDAYYGWIWVPGDVWAPAWVAWRYGDGWVGWAPLPPQVGWNVSVGLNYGSYDIDRDLSQYRWSFCRSSDFTSTKLRTVVVPRSRNVTLLRTTRDVTDYGLIDGRPAERGFTPSILERDLKRKFTRYDIADAPAVGRDRAAVIRGNVVEMYRPVIRGGAPSGNRARPDAQNRPSEQQRLDERSKARTERQRQRAEEQARQGAGSQIESPGVQRQRPNVESPPPGKADVTPPSPPPADTKADLERRQAEQRDLETRIREQRQELKQEQQKELKNPPPGVSREELQRRHQEEQQAQQEVEKRDREALKNREELQRQWRQQQEQARQERQQEQQQQRQEQQQQKQQEQRDRQQQMQQQREQKQQERDQRDRNQNQDQGQDGGQSRSR